MIDGDSPRRVGTDRVKPILDARGNVVITRALQLMFLPFPGSAGPGHSSMVRTDSKGASSSLQRPCMKDVDPTCAHFEAPAHF